MSKSHYLLRDLQEIFGIFENLESAYIYILQFIYNFYRYNKLVKIDIIINNIQIIEYVNNNIDNIFILNNNFKLINSNEDIIYINNISINDIISKLDHYNKINIDSNDLNIFIPNNFFESEKNDLNNELKHIQDKITLLKNIKDTEINNLEQIKINIKEKEEMISVKKNKTDNILNQFKNKKEYYNRIKNKFKIDKDIYFKLKEEISNGDRTIHILPELFIEEFKIFEKLENDNKINLNNSDEIFEEYLKYKPEKKQNFITNFDHIFNNINSDSNDD